MILNKYLLHFYDKIIDENYKMTVGEKMNEASPIVMNSFFVDSSKFLLFVDKFLFIIYAN